MGVRHVQTTLMGVLFLYSAAVQWNDPDAVEWMLAYLVCAAMCFWDIFASDQAPRIMLWVIAIGFLARVGEDSYAAAAVVMWQQVGMSAAAFAHEPVRETVGIVLSCTWMGLQVLSLASHVLLPPEHVTAAKRGISIVSWAIPLVCVTLGVWWYLRSLTCH